MYETLRTWQICCGWVGRLPEAWIASPEVRNCARRCGNERNLSRCARVARQVHAVLANKGVRVPMSDLFGTAGAMLLDELRLDTAYNARIVSLRRLIAALDFEIDVVTRRTAGKLAARAGYQVVQAIDGVGPVLAAIFVAEIGDVTRFTRPSSYVRGPVSLRHRVPIVVHRGRITKQGNSLL